MSHPGNAAHRLLPLQAAQVEARRSGAVGVLTSCGRGWSRIDRPRSRPYDGRPGGLRTGSPPSPPPRSIRPTVRRLPRSPRLSGPGPRRRRRLPPARQTNRPFGAGRRPCPIRRPPIPAPWPRRCRRVPDASPGDVSRGAGRSPRCRAASGDSPPQGAWETARPVLRRVSGSDRRPPNSSPSCARLAAPERSRHAPCSSMSGKSLEGRRGRPPP